MKFIVFLFPLFLIIIHTSSWHLHSHSHHTLYVTPPKINPLSNISLISSSSQQIDFNTFKDALQPYNLTQGETRAFFRLCDHNHNDKLSSKEWDTCMNVFVIPYETQCYKPQANYLLKKADLKACLKKTWFKDIPTKTTTSETPEDALMVALLRNNEGMINFMDYIFLRRLTMAWNECSVDDRLSKRRARCAFAVTTSQKKRFLPVSNQVFNIAIQLYKTKIKENEAFLDFFSFAKIAYLYYYFNEFGLPFQEESLTKKALLLAIEDQVMPTSITVEWVQRIFYELDPDNNGNKLKLSFGGFAGLIHCFQLYNSFAEKRKSGTQFFTEKAFKKMIVEHEWDYFYSTLMNRVTIIENYTLTDSNDTQIDMNEKNYFMRFTERKKKKKNKGKIDKYQIIYKIFDSNSNNNWNYIQLVRFAKMTWVFQGIDVASEGVIYRNDLAAFNTAPFSIIPLTSNEVKAFELISNTIKTDPLNVKQFYTFFTYKQIFSQLLVPGQAKYVTLNSLKTGLKALNLNASNETISSSKEFSTDHLSVPVYNYERGFIRAIKQEIRMIRNNTLSK